MTTFYLDGELDDEPDEDDDDEFGDEESGDEEDADEEEPETWQVYAGVGCHAKARPSLDFRF